MTDHLPLRAVPAVAVALVTVLATLWLAASDLNSRSSLYADPPGAVSAR